MGVMGSSEERSEEEVGRIGLKKMVRGLSE